MCIQTIRVRRPIRPLSELLLNGTVPFVCHLYYGSSSDQEIVERSGLLNPNMFDDGNETMADKGFNIRDLTDLPIFLGSDPGVNLKLMKIEKTTEYTWNVL